MDSFSDFQWFLELFAIPDIRFRWILVGLAVANAIVSIILEDFVTEVGLQKFWNKYDNFKYVFLKNQAQWKYHYGSLGKRHF